jgi:hypothetical protein
VSCHIRAHERHEGVPPCLWYLPRHLAMDVDCPSSCICRRLSGAPAVPRERGVSSSRPRHDVVTHYNAATQALIRRKVSTGGSCELPLSKLCSVQFCLAWPLCRHDRAKLTLQVRPYDADAITRIQMPPPPLPVSWGRTVQPYVPPRACVRPAPADVAELDTAAAPLCRTYQAGRQQRPSCSWFTVGAIASCEHCNYSTVLRHTCQLLGVHCCAGCAGAARLGKHVFSGRCSRRCAAGGTGTYAHGAAVPRRLCVLVG